MWQKKKLRLKSTRHIKRLGGLKGIIAWLITMLFFCQVSMATEGKSASPQNSFENMVDGYMEGALEKYGIPGIAVIAIKDGEVLLEKAYGYADYEDQLPIDVEKTRFRICSVTKTFTAAAALQLVEQGKLDINADITTYIKDVKINNPFKTPITLAHLLTHSAGIAEVDLEPLIETDLKNESEEPMSLSEALNLLEVTVVRHPGEEIQYSNIGATLIGHMVETVSGMSMEEYVIKNIFKPLVMTNSVYWPRKKDIVERAKGYVITDKGSVEKEDIKVAIHPAGSIDASVGDMGKFLMTYLQDGALAGNRILKKETIALAKKPQMKVTDQLPGYGFGLYQYHRNRNIMMHDGDLSTGFSSRLSMLPEKNIGFFIAFNGQTEAPIREEFTQKFYDYFNMALDQDIENIEEVFIGPKIDLTNFSGTYVMSQRILKGPKKIGGFMATVKLEMDKRGELQVKSFERSINGSYVEMQKNLFVNKDKGKIIYLKENQEGDKYAIINMVTPAQTLEKLNAYEVFHAIYLRNTIFIVGILGSILTLVSIVLKLCRRIKPDRTTNAYKISLLAKVINALIVGLGINIVLFLLTTSQSVLYSMKIIESFIIVSCILMLIFETQGIKKKELSFIQVLYSIVSVIAGVGTLVYMKFLNLFIF